MARKKPAGHKNNQPEEPSRPLRLEYRTKAELKTNPRNWRTHPEAQTVALRSLIDDAGWAGALLMNSSSGHLVDGHARLEIAADDEALPVLIGSWTPEQEGKLLAMLDPLSARAEADREKLAALLSSIELEENSSLNTLLDSIAEEHDIKWDHELDTGLASPEQAGQQAEHFEASHVRMIQLFFDTTTFPQFTAMVEKLSALYNTENATDTVFEALRREVDQLTLANAG